MGELCQSGDVLNVTSALKTFFFSVLHIFHAVYPIEISPSFGVLLQDTVDRNQHIVHILYIVVGNRLELALSSACLYCLLKCLESVLTLLLC